MMLGEVEKECLLIEGKSILTKAHEQQPDLDPAPKNYLAMQTCVKQCPYTSKWNRKVRIITPNPDSIPVYRESDIPKP